MGFRKTASAELEGATAHEVDAGELIDAGNIDTK